MSTLIKQEKSTPGAIQASGGALLASIMQHLIKVVPGFLEISESTFFKKDIEANNDVFSVSFVFLQNYHHPDPELDEIVLAQIMIFLAQEGKLQLVPEIVVNLTGSNFGVE